MTVVAVQFALVPTADLTLRVLEMILMDKAPWAAGAGCNSTWVMRGAPEVIVMDRGGAYDDPAIYLAVGRLGITYQGSVAGLPQPPGRP